MAHDCHMDDDGFVYFAQSESGEVKIGFSRNPDERVRKMRFGDRGRVKEIGRFAGKMNAEAFVHDVLQQHRLPNAGSGWCGDSDWFAPSPEVLAWAQHGADIYARTVAFASGVVAQFCPAQSAAAE